MYQNQSTINQTLFGIDVTLKIYLLGNYNAMWIDDN